MMRKLGLAAVSLFLFLTVSGQTYIGIKGGYTMSNISFKPANDSRMLMGGGPELGVAFKYYNAKYVGFQAELYTTHRGYRLPTDETGVYEFKRINQYVELPMFIQFRLNLKIVYIHINAGPFLSYLVSAQEGDNTSGSYKLNKVTFNILRDKRFDYGLIGGAGLSHDFRWGTLQAEARVGYSFGDIYDHTYPNMPNESKSLVQCINFAYFYRFGGEITSPAKQ